VELGKLGLFRRKKALAPSLQHGADESPVGDIARADLPVDHHAACCGKIDHRRNPGRTRSRGLIESPIGKAQRADSRGSCGKAAEKARRERLPVSGASCIAMAALSTRSSPSEMATWRSGYATVCKTVYPGS